MSELEDYRALPDQHRLTLASPDEPGERLYVLVSVVDSAHGGPAALRAVTLYHTSDAGSYEESPPGDDATARLRGTVITDSLGRFLLETILPGPYGSGDDKRHIHTGVAGARPEAYDIFFSQHMSMLDLRWATGSGQAFVGTLWQQDGGLVMSVRMSVRGLEPRGSS